MNGLKIVFLAPANNYHTKKWCKWFSSHGHEVSVISLVPADGPIDAEVYDLNAGVNSNGSDINKLKYLLKIKATKRIIKEINPDIINAHYATSYGVLASFACNNDFIVSAWGSDIYDFPRKSILHKLMLKFILKKAQYIFSTSNAMAKELKKYTDKDAFITPFGVDVDLFSPQKRDRDDDSFIIGTVKTLSPKYGIETLLESVAILKQRYPEILIKVRIAGKGPYEKQYKMKAKNLGIYNCINWLGFISQECAAKEWANFDCAIIPSELESFGVSAVEAQSCGCPVIISDIPGLMEATVPGKTSIVFSRGDAEELAEKIYKVYSNIGMRRMLGENGREFVKATYELNLCFEKIEKFYKNINR